MCYVNCNQLRPGFELVSSCPFPTTMTIIPQTPPLYTRNLVVKFRQKYILCKMGHINTFKIFEDFFLSLFN